MIQEFKVQGFMVKVKPSDDVLSETELASIVLSLRIVERNLQFRFKPGFRNREYQYESMMHRTGVTSVIFRKLFPWIEPMALIFCYFGIKAKVEIENDI